MIPDELTVSVASRVVLMNDETAIGYCTPGCVLMAVYCRQTCSGYVMAVQFSPYMQTLSVPEKPTSRPCTSLSFT